MSQLKNGNKSAAGGARINTGVTNWLRKECLKAVRASNGKKSKEQKISAVKFLEDVWRGKIKDHKVTKDGDVIEVDASIHDRRGAAEYLIDRVGGKAATSLDLTSGGGAVTVRVVNYADMAPKPEAPKKPEEPKK